MDEKKKPVTRDEFDSLRLQIMNLSNGQKSIGEDLNRLAQRVLAVEDTLKKLAEGGIENTGSIEILRG